MITRCLLAAIMLMALVLGAHANAPAKKPDPKPKVVKVVDPKKAAEDARFEGTAASHRKALLELEQLNKKLVDAWVEARDAQLDGERLGLVWGVRARRDAERSLAKLGTTQPRAKADFERACEKQEKKFDHELQKLNKEIQKLMDRPTSSSERLNEIQAKELEGVKAEAAHYEDFLSAMRAMASALDDYKPGGKTDRLSQIGISSHDSAIRKEIKQYTQLVEAAYDIMDLKADIAQFMVRKEAKKDWTSRDEGSLRTANGALEKAGRKIEQLVDRERKTLKRDIDKLKLAIARLDSRIKGSREGSKTQERYTNEKWDLETELLAQENKDALFVRLATWKEPEKKEPAPKKAAH